MRDVRILLPATEVEIVFYAAFCYGLDERKALTPEERAVLAEALEGFRTAYRDGWVRGTAFLTPSELVFIPAGARRAGRAAQRSLRIPLPELLALDVAPGLLRDTVTVRTPKGRFQLCGFRARRFAAQVDQACTRRVGEISQMLQAQAS